MKLNRAWGWLVAGVLAAGLNASYHDGGLQWAHQIAARASYNAEAVLALASGRAGQFLTEARMISARSETASCRLCTALARVQTRVARTETGFERFEVMSAWEEAQLARLEANRARIEAQVAQLRIPAVAVNPVVFAKPVVCPRVRVNVPKPPMMKMPVLPVIHLETASAGPV